MTPPLVRSPSSTPTEPPAASGADVAVCCRVVTTAHERALHHRIREEVFVREQQLFSEHDRDAHDADPATLAILAWCGPVAAGAVRLYPVDAAGEWKGDRLAALPAYRGYRLGAPLVRCAVRNAAQRGGRRMVAHVQPQNVGFFEHLGWRPAGEPVIYVGRPHQRMAIDLV